jgi:hypothetical protein
MRDLTAIAAGAPDKGERRMSKGGLASFMRAKALAHGDAEVERVLERVDANKDGESTLASSAPSRGPTRTWRRCCGQIASSVFWRPVSPRHHPPRPLAPWTASPVVRHRRPVEAGDGAAASGPRRADGGRRHGPGRGGRPQVHRRAEGRPA